MEHHMDYEEHKVIYLEPRCRDCDRFAEDRSWCQDDVWSECEDCGKKPARYVLDTNA